VTHVGIGAASAGLSADSQTPEMVSGLFTTSHPLGEAGRVGSLTGMLRIEILATNTAALRALAPDSPGARVWMLRTVTR
jgi:hypothetical protein